MTKASLNYLAENFAMTVDEYNDIQYKLKGITQAERVYADEIKLLEDHMLVSTGLHIEGEDTYSCLKCEFTCGHPGQFNGHLIRILKGVQYGPRKVFTGEPLNE